MGKGEIARYEQFLLFPQCFQKACFPGASKGVIVWEWVKPITHNANFKWSLKKTSENIVGKGELIVWCFTSFTTVFRLYCGSQSTYPCFPGVLLTSTLHNILSKPLAAFPHNHCRNNELKREEWSCPSSILERILADPGIEPATCTQVLYATDWTMGLRG